MRPKNRSLLSNLKPGWRPQSPQGTKSGPGLYSNIHDTPRQARAGAGVMRADIGATAETLLLGKCHCDLTASGINHPSDSHTPKTFTRSSAS